MSTPRVALIATGGTLDSVGVDRVDLVGYTHAGRRLDVAELLGRVPELNDIGHVEAVDFPRVRSSAISSTQWIALDARLNELLSSGRYTGAVVTHGTNTLEETAYFLNLSLRTDRPVVITGAMRPASALSSDGDLNLVRAVQVAASPEAAGQGVLVVLNDTIHAARDVTKTATYRVDTFESRSAGPLGYADPDGGITLYRSPTRRHTTGAPFSVSHLTSLPSVGIALSFAGADGVVIDALVGAGVRGIVHAGTGAGTYSPPEGESMRSALDHGVVVVQSSRVGVRARLRTVASARRTNCCRGRSCALEGTHPADARVDGHGRRGRSAAHVSHLLNTLEPGCDDARPCPGHHRSAEAS